MKESSLKIDDVWPRICFCGSLYEIHDYCKKHHVDTKKQKEQLILGVIEAIKSERKPIVKYLLSTSSGTLRQDVIQHIFSYALDNNQKELIIIFCKMFDYWNLAFQLASWRHDYAFTLQIVDNMDEKSLSNHLNSFAYAAFKHKNVTIIEKYAHRLFPRLRCSNFDILTYDVIFSDDYWEKYLDFFENTCSSFEWIMGFVSACKYGKLNYVKKIIQKSNVPDSQLSLGFANACAYNKLSVVEYLKNMNRPIIVEKETITHLANTDFLPEIANILLQKRVELYPNTNLKFMNYFSEKEVIRMLNGGVSSTFMERHKKFASVSNIHTTKCQTVLRMLEDFICKDVLLFNVFPYICY